MPFFNDNTPKRVNTLKPPNAPKRSSSKKNVKDDGMIGKSIALFKKRVLETESLELVEMPTEYQLDDMEPKLVSKINNVGGPSFTLFTHGGKPIDLIFQATVDVSEVAYFEPKLCVAIKVDTQIFTPYFERMFNEIDNSGLNISDQTERMRKGLLILKLKVDDQFKNYFDDSILSGMRKDSSENMIIDFLNIVKNVKIHVKARFGVYIDASENRIGIYSTTLMLAL